MSLYSPHWYRAEALTPRLKSHCAIGRQVHRGQVWHVVSNRASGEFFRVTPTAYAVIGLMDGRRTVERIWREAAVALGDDLPTQDDVIQLLSRLHQADLLHSGAAPDMAELAERRDKRARQKLLQSVKNPFAVRVPLVDPDRFLTRWKPLGDLMFTPVAALLYLALIGYAGALALIEWPALSADFASSLAAVETVLLIALVYPAVKAVHELGHGFAVKRWDGEVREMGVMMLFFVPVPYVDASAATAWPDKWPRVLVSAMGVLAELGIAALALIVWASVEPGFVRSLAFAAMTTAGVSTLLFNGNPLLRFDGYYALSDAVEIPNLSKRGNDFVGHLIKRYAFGMARERFPALAPGEAVWLPSYAVAAFLYRIVIAISISILISGWFFELGVLIALFTLGQMLLWPGAKALWRVLFSEAFMKVRKRAVSTTVAGIVAALAAVAFAPLPYSYRADAVVWLGEEAKAVVGESGFVAEAFVAPGEPVVAGAPIWRLESPRLSAQRASAAAQLSGLRASLEADRAFNQAAAQRAREQIAEAEARLARFDARIAALTVRAPSAGAFEPVDRRDPVGRHLQKGAPVGYLIDPERPVTLRLAAPEEAVDLIRERGRALAARFAHLPGRTFAAEIAREAPTVGSAPPHPALTTVGRGRLTPDPTSHDVPRVLERFGLLDVAVLDPPPNRMVGAAATVRVDLGWASLGAQIWRPARQLVLKVISG